MFILLILFSTAERIKSWIRFELLFILNMTTEFSNLFIENYYNQSKQYYFDKQIVFKKSQINFINLIFSSFKCAAICMTLMYGYMNFIV